MFEIPTVLPQDLDELCASNAESGRLFDDGAASGSVLTFPIETVKPGSYGFCYCAVLMDVLGEMQCDIYNAWWYFLQRLYVRGPHAKHFEFLPFMPISIELDGVGLRNGGFIKFVHRYDVGGCATGAAVKLCDTADPATHPMCVLADSQTEYELRVPDHENVNC